MVGLIIISYLHILFTVCSNRSVLQLHLLRNRLYNIPFCSNYIMFGNRFSSKTYMSSIASHELIRIFVRIYLLETATTLTQLISPWYGHYINTFKLIREYSSFVLKNHISSDWKFKLHRSTQKISDSNKKPIARICAQSSRKNDYVVYQYTVYSVRFNSG